MSRNRRNLLKNIFFSILFIQSSYLIDAARQNSFKINTDLTASVVDGGGGGGSGGPNAGSVITTNDYDGSKTQQQHGSIDTNVTHICTREETYIEQIQIPNIQPVRVRSSSWCMEFPPRCSNYKTEMRQVMLVKNVTKTRTIRFCCDGYEASTISLNDTVCKPVCRGGCGRGRCEMPDVCTCDAGYIGKHCTQRCDHDHWGVQCKNECQCQNGAACDNKSGICHCITGWTGVYCEQPCPPGTHGVMCRKACDCSSKHCHPQTGACEDSPHVMIATLNSTIANITHNLDRLAKNIVNIAPQSIIPETSAVTLKTLPEVILIKQDESAHQTPKIIVHQQGAGGSTLLETLQNTQQKPTEVIHVITANSDKDLKSAGFDITSTNQDKNISSEGKPTNDNESNLLTTLLIILLTILIAIALGFLYVYRRYHTQKAQVEAALTSRNIADVSGFVESNAVADVSGGSLGKSFLKPLPDLPAFTQMMRNKIEAHEYYDSPSSNISVQTPPYTYARKESLYSIVAPKSRRGSSDTHLYDEIRYPGAAHHHHHPHHQHQSTSQNPNHHHHHQPHHHQTQPENHLQHSAYGMQAPVSHHITQLVIPPQNSKYLQVPQATYTTHRIAHM